MDLSLWSIKTKNWSVDSFKTHHLNELLHFSPRYSQVTLVSQYPFLTPAGARMSTIKLCLGHLE